MKKQPLVNKETVTNNHDMIAKAFCEHGKLVKQIARKYAGTQGSRIELGDIESYLNEMFMEACLRYDETKGSLGAYLNARLNQHARNFIKTSYHKSTLAHDTFSAIDGGNEEDGEDTPTFEETKLTDGVYLEDTAIKQMEVKRAVSEMLANATDLQRRIMEVYMKAEVKPSFTQIGKALGVHHETVKRELAKLAKTTAFDASLLY